MNLKPTFVIPVNNDTCMYTISSKKKKVLTTPPALISIPLNTLSNNGYMALPLDLRTDPKMLEIVRKEVHVDEDEQTEDDGEATCDELDERQYGIELLDTHLQAKDLHLFVHLRVFVRESVHLCTESCVSPHSRKPAFGLQSDVSLFV